MPAGQTRLSEAQVREKYQSCPTKDYSGPRPGKARYTKDNFLWVVTPEFARKFCMPPEFVSSELKGAEAVAFRIVEDADEERCGWGGRGKRCARGARSCGSRFTSGVGCCRRSAMCRITTRHICLQQDADHKIRKGVRCHSPQDAHKPRLGALGPFETSQFGLNGFRDGKVVWPIATLYAELYYEEALVESTTSLSRDSPGASPTHAWAGVGGEALFHRRSSAWRWQEQRRPLHR